MENFDAAINAVVSAKFVVEQADEQSVCTAAGFVIRTLMDEAYRAIMEMRQEIVNMEAQIAQVQHDDPEWIVEKPVPVGSEAAKRIVAKVATDNPPPKKKGRPRKNDD